MALRGFRLRGPAVAAVLALPAASLPAAVGAAGFEGRVALELEYLGENYFNEVDIIAADDLGDAFRLTDTTKFTDDTWLPGQRLELGWIRDLEPDLEFDLRSATGYNRERFVQSLEARLERRCDDGGRLTLEADGDLRDEERSLVGHGDWRTRLGLRRTLSVGSDGTADLRVGWDHSRTRGDTTSFLYDFDRVEARVSVSGGGAWFPTWEVYLEGGRKSVADGDDGSYDELRTGTGWRPGDAARTALSLDFRYRNYDRDGNVGRDVLEAELDIDRRLWRSADHSVDLDLDLSAADYRSADEIYYDYVVAEASMPWEWSDGRWEIGAAPRLRGLRDLEGEARDYLQSSIRIEGGRSLGLLGFAQLSLEAGRRNYREDDPTAIEVDVLSITLLRSDYWLLDVMLLADIPLGAGFSLDILADTLMEFHDVDAERIRVTLATVSVARAF